MTTLNLLVLRETSYGNSRLQHCIAVKEPLLNPDQSSLYSSVLDNIHSNTCGIIFLDALGQTGETFVLDLISANVRQNDDIAIAVASSCVAFTLLEDGCTARLAFKMSLDVLHQQNIMYNITTSLEEAALLKSCKLCGMRQPCHTKDLLKH